MKRFIIKSIIMFVFSYLIILIGSNTGGNSILNFKVPAKKNTDITLKDIFEDLFSIILFLILGIISTIYFQDDRLIIIIITIVLELIFIVILIKDIKNYKKFKKNH